jgi:hypothetical protein
LLTWLHTGRCILSAQPAAATALAALPGQRLRMLHADCLRFFGRVAYDDQVRIGCWFAGVRAGGRAVQQLPEQWGSESMLKLPQKHCSTLRTS